MLSKKVIKTMIILSLIGSGKVVQASYERYLQNSHKGENFLYDLDDENYLESGNEENAQKGNYSLQIQKKPLNSSSDFFQKPQNFLFQPVMQQQPQPQPQQYQQQPQQNQQQPQQLFSNVQPQQNQQVSQLFVQNQQQKPLFSNVQQYQQQPQQNQQVSQLFVQQHKHQQLFSNVQNHQQQQQQQQKQQVQVSKSKPERLNDRKDEDESNFLSWENPFDELDNKQNTNKLQHTIQNEFQNNVHIQNQNNSQMQNNFQIQNNFQMQNDIQNKSHVQKKIVKETAEEARERAEKNKILEKKSREILEGIVNSQSVDRDLLYRELLEVQKEQIALMNDSTFLELVYERNKNIKPSEKESFFGLVWKLKHTKDGEARKEHKERAFLNQLRPLVEALFSKTWRDEPTLANLVAVDPLTIWHVKQIREKKGSFALSAMQEKMKDQLGDFYYKKARIDILKRIERLHEPFLARSFPGIEELFANSGETQERINPKVLRNALGGNAPLPNSKFSLKRSPYEQFYKPLRVALVEGQDPQHEQQVAAAIDMFSKVDFKSMIQNGDLAKLLCDGLRKDHERKQQLDGVFYGCLKRREKPWKNDYIVANHLEENRLFKDFYVNPTPENFFRMNWIWLRQSSSALDPERVCFENEKKSPLNKHGGPLFQKFKEVRRELFSLLPEKVWLQLDKQERSFVLGFSQQNLMYLEQGKPRKSASQKKVADSCGSQEDDSNENGGQEEQFLQMNNSQENVQEKKGQEMSQEMSQKITLKRKGEECSLGESGLGEKEYKNMKQF